MLNICYNVVFKAFKLIFTICTMARRISSKLSLERCLMDETETRLQVMQWTPASVASLPLWRQGAAAPFYTESIQLWSLQGYPKKRTRLLVSHGEILSRQSDDLKRIANRYIQHQTTAINDEIIFVTNC